MSEISKRPWEIAEIEEDEDGRMVKYEHLVDANGYVLEPYIHNADKPTLEFIVKAVNEHDKIVAEVERLNTTVNDLSERHKLIAKYLYHNRLLSSPLGEYLLELERQSPLIPQEDKELRQRAEKAEAEVERLRQYIRENGYCGYHGTKYEDVYPDCTRCYDSEQCERYKIIKDGEADA